MEKFGAFFWNEDNGATRPVVFAEARDPRHPKAYQVKRAEFDDLLLRHSASCGAEVREETAVEDVLFEGGRAVGVRVRGAGADPEEIRAKVVVDASGQGAVLSRKLGLRRFDPKLKRAALFAHYEGIRWPEGSRVGDILLPIDDGIWYWIIPFSDGTCSVGGVFDPDGGPLRRRRVGRGALRGDDRRGRRGCGRCSPDRGASPGSTACPTTRRPLRRWPATAGSSSATRPRSSIRSSRPASSSRSRPASVPRRRSTARSRAAAASTAGISRRTAAQSKRMWARFRRFVYGFYDPVFFEAFCTPAPPERIRAAVVTTLAGGVERVSPAMWFWTKLMFVGVGIDRTMRRLTGKTAPAG